MTPIMALILCLAGLFVVDGATLSTEGSEAADPKGLLRREGASRPTDADVSSPPAKHHDEEDHDEEDHDEKDHDEEHLLDWHGYKDFRASLKTTDREVRGSCGRRRTCDPRMKAIMRGLGADPDEPPPKDALVCDGTETVSKIQEATIRHKIAAGTAHHHMNASKHKHKALTVESSEDMEADLDDLDDEELEEINPAEYVCSASRVKGPGDNVYASDDLSGCTSIKPSTELVDKVNMDGVTVKIEKMLEPWPAFTGRCMSAYYCNGAEALFEGGTGKQCYECLVELDLQDSYLYDYEERWKCSPAPLRCRESSDPPDARRRYVTTATASGYPGADANPAGQTYTPPRRRGKDERTKAREAAAAAGDEDGWLGVTPTDPPVADAGADAALTPGVTPAVTPAEGADAGATKSSFFDEGDDEGDDADA